MTDWKDILKEDDELSEQELMQYLKGNASEETRFAIEQKMADSNFVNDAVEGLQEFSNPVKLAAFKDQLNLQLKKVTQQKATRKKKLKIQDQQWLIVAVLAILALSVAGYLLIHFYSK